MGKMKRGRQKAHSAAVKLKQKEKSEKGDQSVEVVDMEQDSKPLQQSPFLVPENPFAGVQIDLNRMKKDLPDFDARSAVTSKSLKGNNLTKVEKRKLKHDFFIKKIDAIQAAKKADKVRKKRKKTPVVGDMQVLADSLPTLDLLLKDNPVDRAREKSKSRVSKKPIPKTKTRQKRMMEDIAIFNQVLAHPAFKSDPQATMKEHVKNWTEQEKMAQ